MSQHGNTYNNPFSSCESSRVAALIIVIILIPLTIFSVFAWLIWLHVLVKTPNICPPAIQFLMRCRAITDVVLLCNNLYIYEPFSEFNRFSCHNYTISIMIEDYFCISVYASIQYIRNVIIIILTATRLYFAKYPQWSLSNLTTKRFKVALVPLIIFCIVYGPASQISIMYFGKYGNAKKNETYHPIVKALEYMEYIGAVVLPLCGLLLLLLLLEIHICCDRKEYDADSVSSHDFVNKKKRLLWMTRLEVLFFTLQYVYTAIQFYISNHHIVPFWISRLAISTMMLTSFAYILVILKFVEKYRDTFKKFVTCQFKRMWIDDMNEHYSNAQP